MIRTNPVRFRRGFTLIEMLVVMALIATLAAIAMLVAPGAMNKDRAATAVAQIQGALQISRARAIRDGAPRGVRFIFNGSNLVTEYQYIEVVPMFVPNPGAPLGVTPYNLPAPLGNPPYVQFNYTPSTGSVNNRVCTINSLDPGHASQITVGGSLYLPTLGTLHFIRAVSVAGSTATVTLDTYPDQQLGAETQWRTYHFGLNGGVRTLLGEPTLPLPYGSCVDITPGFTTPSNGGGKDYDILFTPSGLIDGNSSTNGAGQIFLWVRDPNKPNNFNQGGEQLVVSIKAKSGGIGAAPVDWGPDPFILAKKALSGQ